MTNAAYTTETVYDPSGAPHNCSRLNAIDLVRYNGFSWRPQVTATAIPEPVEILQVEEPAPVVEEAPLAPVDAATADLEEVATAVADVPTEEYLKGFSAEALRTMAEERYGIKLRATTSVEQAIKRILAAEEARALA